MKKTKTKKLGKKKAVKRNSPKKKTKQKSDFKEGGVVIEREIISVVEIPEPSIEPHSRQDKDGREITNITDVKPERQTAKVTYSKKDLQILAQAIHDSARKHFRPMTIKEITDLINYNKKHTFKTSIHKKENSANEIYLMLEDGGGNIVRSPLDENEFIKISAL